MKKIAILLIPGFPLVSFSVTAAAINEANRLSGQPLYEMALLSESGESVKSEGDVCVEVQAKIDAREQYDFIILVSGVHPLDHIGPEVAPWVRRHITSGALIGAASTATEILARLGMLRNRRCTIHWENAGGFAENYPDTLLSDSLFTVDGRFWTSSGGTAALDMIVNFLARDQGPDLAVAVSHQFQQDRIRSVNDLQNPTSFYAQQNKSAVMTAALEYIHSSHVSKLSPWTIAEHLGISQRHLARVFQTEIKKTPGRYIMQLKLNLAQELLSTTTMNISEVAYASGFNSGSAFYAAYKRLYGRTPHKGRNLSGRVLAALTT